MASQQQRISRMNQIKSVIKARSLARDFLPKEKFIARLCCDWGISRRTALEYIDNVIMVGYAREEQIEGEKLLIWCKEETRP